MMMERSHLEDASPFTVFLLRIFEIERLHKNGEILYQEDATQDRDQQFLPDNDCEYGDDTAQLPVSPINTCAG